jgi:capsular polysaccharide biosynthesis protein
MSVFKQYWRTVQQKTPIVLMVSFVVALVAWMIVRGIGASYEVHFSYLISLSQREEVSDYSFDGYYALQATDLFTATLAQWIKTPEVIVEAHKEAEINLKSSDPRALGRRIKAVKTAPQLIEVTVKGESRQETERLAQGVRMVMKNNVERYHDKGIPALRFRVVETEPWVGQQKLSIVPIVVATFIFIFFMGINVVLLMESVRRM